MNEQQFAYWLQGFAELSGDAPPTAAQWKSIREHLELVFTKVTPKVGAPRIPIDLKDSQAIKDLLEQARKSGGVAYAPYQGTLNITSGGLRVDSLSQITC